MMGHDFQQCFGVVFSSSNLSCCPVQKNGLDATALFKACNPKPMALIKACMALVKACMALFKACIAILWHLSFILFFPTSHPSQPAPRKCFHFHFFAIPEVEWSWQRLLLCCLATSFGFGPCPFGLCWHSGLPPSELSVPSPFPSLLLLLLLLLLELDLLSFVPAKSWL